MSAAATEAEARRRRTRYPVALAVAIGCYVLAAMAGTFFLANGLGLALLIPLWTAHGVLLTVLLRRLGARESSVGTALFIVFLSVMSLSLADVVRDDLTLQRRGEKVTATVVEKWPDPPRGRGGPRYNYELERQDGTRVLGPTMTTDKERYDLGQVLTVFQDPKGELAPRTPGRADATAETLGAGGFALTALGTVGWLAWRGSDAARRRDRRKGTTGEYKALARQKEQEEKLREALRTHPVDRRGYIKVHPEDYPALSQQRAARIAWEMGLRAEAWGNQGSWRFKESVIEEVPLD
ncbi:hypothetical protein ACF09J_17235 [Streptomyces sp. NPDC014889]|uniref:hypothetical protein n=1 Tax=Streptomyces sp. NPDC014889 TaxID=3364928 RepID=UPI003700B97C